VYDGVTWQVVSQVDEVLGTLEMFILSGCIKLEQFVIGEAVHPFGKEVHLIHIQKLIFQHGEGCGLVNRHNKYLI
jgi:hypothetical protein